MSTVDVDEERACFIDKAREEGLDYALSNFGSDLVKVDAEFKAIVEQHEAVGAGYQAWLVKHATRLGR